MILIVLVLQPVILTARSILPSQVFAKSFIIISWLPVFISAIYALRIYKRLGKKLKLFSIFLFLSGIVQAFASIAWLNKINNLPLLHFYVAAAFVCIALFYREVFRDFLDQRILLFVALAFVLFTIINAVFFQSVFSFSSRTLTVQSVLIIIFSLSTFMLTLNEHAKDIPIAEQKSIKWINSGFFIYYSTSLLIFYFGDVFTRIFPVSLNQNTWILHSFFSIIMYTCFIIALWKRPKSLIS